MNSEIQTNRDTFGLLESLDLLDCETKKRRRHALFHTDDSNKNFLHLAIEAHEINICKMMIEKVDSNNLNEYPIIGNKKAIGIIKEKMLEGHDEFNVLIDIMRIKSKTG